MKRLFVLCLIGAGNIFGQTVAIELMDGTMIPTATISSKDAYGVTIMTDSGIQKLYFEDMAQHTREELGYDRKAQQKALEAEKISQQKRVIEQRQEQIWSPWKAAIEHLRERSLNGPIEMRQKGAIGAEVETYRSKTIEEMKTLELKYQLVRLFATTQRNANANEEDIERMVNCIFEEKLYVGMPADAARLSWGNPNDINRSYSKSGTSEQWVYNRGNVEREYIHVEGGVITFMSD